MNNITVTIQGLRSLDDLNELPARIATIASRAINQVTRRSRAESSRRIRQQIAFPARYLSGQDGKIAMRPSNAATLESRLSASSDPRSLARFVVGSGTGRRGSKKVSVQVAPGAARMLPGAFLLKISGDGGNNQNTLLAVRSRNRPTAAYQPRQIGKGLWSLYGPSVSQGLLSADEKKGIWPQMEPEIAEALEREFLRQMKVEGL